MINCKYTNYNEIVTFGTISEEKYNPGKTILRGLIDRIESNYQEYLTEFPTLESKPNSIILGREEAEKEALGLCYTSPTITFRYIKGKIFEIQPDPLKTLCPYCLLDRPSTLDHYISQTEFPEYSILQKNLIPCCYHCNNRKGERWRKSRIRRYIHFYNDTFLANRFLFGNLIYPRGSVTPRISLYIRKPIALSVSEYRVVKFHFKDLDLIDQYQARANTMISSEIDIMLKSINNGVQKAVIIKNLADRADTLAVDYGVNYWKVSLYEAISKCKKLLDSL